jgi:two-component system chemotaxis sensor kinase CheA
MDDLIAEFLTETDESLAKLDSEILQLESYDENVIGSIFRIIHTIKGTCGFLGLAKLEHLAHAAENVLNKVADKTLEPSSAVISVIFLAIDTIKQITAFIKENGVEPDNDYHEIVAKLEAFLDNTEAADISPPQVEEELLLSEDPFADIIKQYEDELKALSTTSQTTEATPKPTAEPIIATPTADVSEASKETPSKEVTAKTASKTKTNAESIRIKLSLLNKLMQTASELVLARNQLLQVSRENYNASSLFNSPIQRISLITSELQESIMKTKMQPISRLWSAYSKIVRDKALELGKKVNLVTEGEDTELDRNLLELIKAPLAQLISNSVDHGIESPLERTANNKPEAGTITLKAHHEGSYVIISISDNGQGLNRKQIKEKILEQGLVEDEALAQMSDSQIYQYIFHPGFSTAQTQTAGSEDGVGLDVVKTNVEKLGGAIFISTVANQGTNFTIKIPITRAIMPAIIIESQKLKFAFPLANVVEILRVNQDKDFKIEFINNFPILKLRDKVLPLLSLAEQLKLAPVDITKLETDKYFVVIVKVAEQSFGLIIDRVHDIEEIVVKPLGQAFKSINKYSGSTILGDGSIAMILDPNSCLSEVSHSSKEIETSDQVASFLEQYRPEQKAISYLLLFEVNQNSDLLAVPLEAVARIEEIHHDSIETLAGKMKAPYRDSFMRLLKINDAITPDEDGFYQVIVFNDGTNTLGLIVEKMLDVVKHEFANKLPQSLDQKVMSVIVVDNRTTEVIDISYYFRQEFYANEETFHANKETFHANEETIPLPKNPANKPHVLLVDDSAFFRKFIPPTLVDAGYKVTPTDSVESALKLLAKHPDICAIITDMNMPGKGGVDLLEHCKSNNSLSGKPIIALSAFSKDAVLKQSDQGSKFDAYIPKTQHTKLLETLNALVA